jgi:hypothetical protein
VTKVLVDTNLLVLFILGSAARQNIGRHKRVRGFTEFEFDILKAKLARATTFVVTPHILAETSNLLDIGKRADRATVELYINYAQLAEEIFVPAEEVVMRAEFVKFGLTDSAIHQIVSEPIEVLTVDYDLYGSLHGLGAKVENIRHFYPMGGLNGHE